MQSPFEWRQEVGNGLLAAFTGVSAGNLALHVGDDPDAVRARRLRLEEQMGVPPRTLRFMNQIHSAAVADAMPSDPDSAPAASVDALVSPGARVPLAVMVADCVPVLLAGTAESGPVTAAAHAGRAGLLAGILPATVRRMRSHGARNIGAWIGPSICGRCYEVPAAMRDEAASALPDVPELAATTSWGTPSLDLPAAALRQLTDLDVAAVRVGSCTLETEDFPSHRRGSSGRFAGLIWRS